jgi:hypothetical protein
MRRRGKQLRRSRSVVLIGFGLFALSQVLLAIAAETILPELRDPAFGIRSRLLATRLSEAGRMPDIVFFGSSRIETGIQAAAVVPPDANGWCFNFGLTGGGPIHQWLAFRRLMENGVRPKVAVIEIMPAMLVDARPVEQCVHADRLSGRDIADLSPFCTDIKPMIGDWLAARAAPIYSSRFLILSRFLPTWLPIANRTDYLWAEMDRWGGQRLPATVNNPEQKRKGWERARQEYVDRLNQFEISPHPAEFIRRLIDECLEKEVVPLLILMPESAQFRSLYPPDALRRLDSLLSELQAAVLDCRDWLGDDAFYDGHHLLPAGAATLSQRLRPELEKLLDQR